MKRLLLTSSGSFITQHCGLDIFQKPFNELKIVRVITASGMVPDVLYIERHTEEMNRLGFDFVDIDIKDMNKQELSDVLRDKDAVFVEGGNPFYLLKWVKRSGFGELVKQLIDGGLIYIGASAGAYVMCHQMEMPIWSVSHWSLPTKELKDKYELDDFNGLGLIDFLVQAHFKEEDRDFLANQNKISKYPIRVLTDDQAFLVQGDEVRLVGGGEEIKP